MIGLNRGFLANLVLALCFVGNAYGQAMLKNRTLLLYEGALEEIGRQLQAAPDEQVSLTDPDARATATGGDHRVVIGYNVQAAVDNKHYIVVANAVTNRGHDRSLEMAKAAQAELGADTIALADRGYYQGEQIRSYAAAGIIPMVPKPNTSPAQARSFWGKATFMHELETGTYRCPAGEQLQLLQSPVSAQLEAIRS